MIIVGIVIVVGTLDVRCPGFSVVLPFGVVVVKASPDDSVAELVVAGIPLVLEKSPEPVVLSVTVIIVDVALGVAI